MTTRVERIGDQFSIQVLLTEEAMEALSLTENDVLEVKTVDGKLSIEPTERLPRHLEAYRRTRGEHEAVYRELAK